MPEQTPRTLSHFGFFSFQPAFFQCSSAEREQFHRSWLDGLRQSAQQVDLYQVYPAGTSADLLVWSSIEAEDPAAPAAFFERLACATNPYRSLLAPAGALWGFTKPSQYTRTRSAQEIDPFAGERKPYLVIYPFVKTKEWYLMSREARQGMMNEHIRVGKQYPEITQLLLYSIGLQDQEFVVVYETADLGHFSDLVYELRDSEARRYTERDTPLYTAIYHPAEETLALWR
jgi:chlorite dismutase